MSNVRYLSKAEMLEMYPASVGERIKPMVADDGKEYYIAYMSSQAYRYLKPDHWQDALDRSKKQLGKLRYWS